MFTNASYPFTSKRNVLYAKNGMVATSEPHAAQAGLDILKKGGNAVDAAICTAACLTVVEPTSNGIGGDCFAIVWMKESLYGLNASGHSPASISIERVKALGHDVMPRFGLTPVMVPGAPKGWAELSKRFGALPFEDVIAPAITLAKEGFAISETVAQSWKNAYTIYKKHLKDDVFQSWFDTFIKEDKAPEPGDIITLKDHAKTLELIANTHADAFYKGEIADKIDAFSSANNGFIRATDLANYSVDFVIPISVNYRGYDIWELPPNNQGLIALEALNVLKHLDFTETNTSESMHKQIEATKLAFANGLDYITDPKHIAYDPSHYLSNAYAKIQLSRIKNHAIKPTALNPAQSGTVYLATADKDGNMVSMIQSNYMGFGSGIVIPNTGIAMQNRGHTFSLDPNHANHLAPNKKTYHTIIPGFITKARKAIGPFGVMGGFMQPQGHVQVIMNMIDFKMNPQAALDAPRWQWIKDKTIHIEDTMDKKIITDLVYKGHHVSILSNYSSFGRGQIIIRDHDKKTYIGGTEKRADGTIAIW